MFAILTEWNVIIVYFITGIFGWISLQAFVILLNSNTAKQKSKCDKTVIEKMKCFTFPR